MKVVVIAIAILLLPSIFGMNIQDEMQENHDYKVVMAIEKHGSFVTAYARMINATTNKFIFHWGDGSITTIHSNGKAVAEHSYEKNGMYKIRVEAIGNEKYRSNVEYTYIGKDDECVFAGSIDNNNENMSHAIAIGNVVMRGMKATFQAYGNWLHRWDFDNNGIYDTPWINEKEIRHVYAKPYNGFAKLQVKNGNETDESLIRVIACLLYTSPSPRDRTRSRMPSSA